MRRHIFIFETRQPGRHHTKSQQLGAFPQRQQGRNGTHLVVREPEFSNRRKQDTAQGRHQPRASSLRLLLSAGNNVNFF